MTTAVDNMIIGFILWTILSIIYVITNLGNKNKPDPWYVWFIGLPALVMAYLYGVIFVSIPNKVEKYRKENSIKK